MNKGRPREHKEELVQKYWELGYGDDEIAEMIGVTAGTVQVYRNMMGLSSGRAISKYWLKTSGIGDQWDRACKRIRG